MNKTSNLFTTALSEVLEISCNENWKILDRTKWQVKYLLENGYNAKNLWELILKHQKQNNHAAQNRS